MLQEMIDESYEHFVDIIEAGRNMSEAQVKKVADGRVLGGTQALRAGLVDEIGNEEATINALRKDFGLEDAALFEYTMDTSSWGSLLGVKLGSMLRPCANRWCAIWRWPACLQPVSIECQECAVDGDDRAWQPARSSAHRQGTP